MITDSSTTFSKLESGFNSKKKIVAIIAAVLILIVAFILIFGKNVEESSEDMQIESDLSTNILNNDKIYSDLIDKGKDFENIGNKFRTIIDSLPQNNDSVFEDYYIRSLELYNQVSAVKDSISEIVFLRAKDRINTVKQNLDSAYQIFNQKADLMQDLGQNTASEIFRERALKVELYINDNENE